MTNNVEEVDNYCDVFGYTQADIDREIKLKTDKLFNEICKLDISTIIHLMKRVLIHIDDVQY